MIFEEIRPAWQERAACLGKPMAWFWPDLDNGRFFTRDQLDDIERGKSVCAACPVREPCLEQGLAQQRGVGGVWGGIYLSARRWDKLHQERATPAA